MHSSYQWVPLVHCSALPFLLEPFPNCLSLQEYSHQTLSSHTAIKAVITSHWGSFLVCLPFSLDHELLKGLDLTYLYSPKYLEYGRCLECI